MEFTIGRKETNDLVLDDNQVSGSHAKIEVGPDFEPFTLIDLDSANGTFINGRRIHTKRITEKDRFMFAGKEITGDVLLNKVKAFVLEKRTDFSKEFKQLLVMEQDYRSRRRKINKYYRLLAMLPRLLITVGVVAAIFLIPDIDPELKYSLMIGASIIGTVVSGFGVSEQRKEERLNDLRAKFQIHFACPKCGTELSAGGRDGKYYSEKNKCPNRKCNAVWHINHVQ